VAPDFSSNERLSAELELRHRDCWVPSTGLPDGLLFLPKIQIESYFGGPLNGKYLYTYFMTIWSILRPVRIFHTPFDTVCGPFGIFFPFWNV
jgi:hypothetical protein